MTNDLNQIELWFCDFLCIVKMMRLLPHEHHHQKQPVALKCRPSGATLVMGSKIIAVILAFLAVAAAEVAQFRRCDKVSQDLCTVTELRVAPCRRYPCLLKKGNNASLAFDFTPNFSASKLKTAVYWADDPTETPFSSVGIIDGCEHSTCPLAPGTPNTLDYSLYIGKKLPNGKFWFRWKLWNEDNPEQVCCFETQVELKK